MELRKIYLEISNICNVQCSFCPIVERDKKKMNIQQIDRIFQKIKGRSFEVCLHLMGEPTAHSDIIEIIELASRYELKINLTTNGLLIKRYGDKFLELNALRQINFSFQAYQDNFPHKDLNLYLEPIFDFTKSAFIKKPDLYINYRLWNIKEGGKQNEIFFEVVEKEFNVKLNRNIQVENIKSKKIINRLYFHFDSRFVWPEMNQEVKGDKGRCHGLVSHIGIHADGTVVPCCLDKEAVLNLGNIHHETLEEIYSKPRTVKMLDGFKNNNLVEDLCMRCDYIKRFQK